MSTAVELMSSMKEELLARYKSPFWGPAILAILCAHWKIVIFLVLGKPSPTEAIEFIQANSSLHSVSYAVGFAIAYVILFPWFELLLSKASSYGMRSRNTFQVREREKEITRRKAIAQQEAQATELEFKNQANQSKLSDIELVRGYQGILSGENFSRWLKDAQQGIINTNLNNSIVNYLVRVDTPEGKFIDPEIAAAHDQFVTAISLLLSTINDSRSPGDDGKRSDLVKATNAAYVALHEYRKQVREKLGI